MACDELPDFNFCRYADAGRSAYLDGRKKIGVKYCGGCNQTYDRVGLVDQVRSLVEDRFIVSCGDRHDIDVLVCVSGCSRACADAVSNKTNGSRPTAPTRSIVDENDFGNLIEWLTGFDKNGD